MPNIPCIAASSYLNAAPLCYSFIYGSQKDRCTFLSDEAPVRCSELLAEGHAHAALIPVIEYQRIPNLRLAPGACVASKRSVRSVLLASKIPITDVRTVALDTSSRTSAALIQIILGNFYSIEASYTTFPPKLEDMLESNDAEKDRIQRSFEQLKKMSAMIDALTAGVPVDLEKMAAEPPPEDLIPLKKLWHETE